MKPSVLIVEDHELVAEPLVIVLGKNGYPVTWVTRPAEALAFDEPFGLAIIDIRLAQSDGLSLVRAFRVKPGFQRMPILTMTAHPAQGERLAALQAGASDHLVKPFSIAELLTAVEYWAGQDPGDGYPGSVSRII